MTANVLNSNRETRYRFVPQSVKKKKRTVAEPAIKAKSFRLTHSLEITCLRHVGFLAPRGIRSDPMRMVAK